MKKSAPVDTIIDAVPLTVTKPTLYEVTIQGAGAILFNKIPDDFGKPPGSKPNNIKTDPIEKEWATWRSKTYATESGDLYIPGENIHECLKDGARYWGQRIPGEGQKTYTDVIARAIVCEDMMLGVKADSDMLMPFGKNVNGNPSKGKRSGTRVYKIRPMLSSWGGTFRMHVFDARLTEDVLKVVLTYAGTFIGLCDWRPTYGRFELVDLRRVG